MNDIESLAGQIRMLSEKLEIFTREEVWKKAREQVTDIRDLLTRWEAAAKSKK